MSNTTLNAKTLYLKMADRNMSQEDLAQASGVDRHDISRFLRGLNKDPATAAKIEEALLQRPIRPIRN